jgi:hypothetical protein
MSNRTIVEFNHDYAGEIRKYPEQFVQLVGLALNSGSEREWEPLERFGVRQIVMRHHSDDAEVVLTKHDLHFPLG